MTFSNPLFYWIFLPASLALFAFLGRFGIRYAIGSLVVMSMIFYAEWSPIYLLLLIASVLVNFFIARLITASFGDERWQSRWLFVGISINLLALGYYKYMFPALESLAKMGLTHSNWNVVTLPLGISFFTFTQIAYLVDLRQQVAEPETLLNYSLFVTFFPHLIAGPIIHNKDMMPQFRALRMPLINSEDLSLGLTWFSMGMFKKVMVADKLGPSVDKLFLNPAQAGTWDTWFGVLGYAMQLYFDFSGYSDMALGLARMFSIRFPINFNSPYKAESVIDFWQRWHITLTRYITDYVYSPVLMWVIRRRQEQGKKSTKKAQATFEGFMSLVAFPTMFALVLAGIWHGAGLQYLLYGVMYGVYLTGNHLWRTFVPAGSLPRRFVTGPVAVLITFFFVLLAEVMFRAMGTRGAFEVYSGLFGLHGSGSAWSISRLALVGGLLAVVWLMPNTQEILGEQQKSESSSWSIFHTPRWRPTWVWFVFSNAIFLVSMAYSTSKSTFLYFQF